MTWELNNASASGTASVDNAVDIDIRDDGSQIYFNDASSDSLYSYEFGTTGDVSTLQNKKTVNHGNTSIQDGLHLKDDGTKVYFTGSSGNIYTASLSRKYDITSIGSISEEFNSSRSSTWEALTIVNNGNDLYVADETNQEILHYSLSTAYDTSTATLSNSLDVSGEVDDTEGLHVRDDGKRVYVLDDVNQDVQQYDLSTAYDLTTASATHTLDVSGASGNSSYLGVTFKGDGTRVYVHEDGNNVLAEYDIEPTIAGDGAYDQKRDGQLSFDLVDDYTQKTDGQLSFELINATKKKLTETFFINDSDIREVKEVLDEALSVDEAFSHIFLASGDLIDDFEDNDLSEYTGDTGNFSTTSTPVYDGSYALQSSSDNSLIQHDGSDASLNTPSQGDDFQLKVRDEGGSYFGFVFFSDGSGRASGDKYFLEVNNSDGIIELLKYDNGNETSLASSSYGGLNNEWMRIKVVTKTDGTIDVTIEDSDGKDLASLSAIDNNRTSGEFGFRTDGLGVNSTVYWDEAYITTTAQTITETLTENFSVDETRALKTMRDLGETVSLSEAYARDVDYFRTYSDSFGINDSDVRQVEEKVTESFALNEVFSEQTTFRRSVSENFTLNDADVRRVFEVLSEDFTLDEALASKVNYFRDFSEAATLDDSDVKQFDEAVVEGFSLNESFNRSGTFKRSQTESLALGETFGRDVDYFRTVSEGFALDETFDSSITFSEVLKETLGLNERFDRTGQYFRDYSEVFSVDDTDSYTISKVLSDSVGLNDVIGSTDVFKVISEDLTLNDSDIKQAEKTLKATLALNDSFNRSADYFRNLQEDFTLDETFSTVVSVFITLDEGISVNEFYSRDADYFRDYTDSISLNDADIRQLERTLEEVFALDGTVADATDYVRTVSETLALNDADVRRIDEVLTEGLSLNEAFSRDVDYFRDFSETAALDEQNSKTVFSSVQEDMVLSDFRSLEARRALGETLVLDDVLTRRLNRKLEEDLTLSETFETDSDFFRALEEMVVLDEADIKQLERTLEEVMALNGVYSRSATFERSVSEGFSLDEKLSRKTEKGLGESIVFDEAFDSDNKFFRNYSEVFSLDDSESYKVLKALNEVLSVDDVLNREITFRRSLEENLNLQATFSVFRALTLTENISVSGSVEVYKALNLSETLGVFAELDYFFSEGPGTPPYWVRLSFFQSNKIQNAFSTYNVSVNASSPSHTVNLSYGQKKQS